jgi:hypothetical protein
MDPNLKASRQPQKPRGKRAELMAWMEARERAGEIGEEEYGQICRALAPVSAGYLRKLLRESGAALAPLVEGVRQDSMESLERTLLALLGEYERSDPFRRKQIRDLIIEAKDHARLAARRNPQKQEMILWMLTWLENPSLFREWLALRKRAEVR